MSRKGFTLIELVMVIVIIGILAAVAIPKFVSLQTEAKRAVCQSNVGAIRTALSNFYAKCNINVSRDGGGCPDGVACDVAVCFPNAAQLNYGATATTFATEYFADGKLPVNTSITGTVANWGDSAAYDNTTGVINMTDCCG
ncbi:MAG: prepilin-type N-terminal cleavage/methylation domain-containing protein [Candidatus Omnitrophota bacterium]